MVVITRKGTRRCGVRHLKQCRFYLSLTQHKMNEQEKAIQNFLERSHEEIEEKVKVFTMALIFSPDFEIMDKFERASLMSFLYEVLNLRKALEPVKAVAA